MVKNDGPRLTNIVTVVDRKPTRRELLQQMLRGTLAGVVLPLLPELHAIRKHLANSAVLFAGDAQLEVVDWKPQFLTAQQDESVIALSEGIVPGSAKARVDRFIDLLLSVDTPLNQQKFVSSLSAIDTESQQRFGHPFSSLTVSQKNILLTVAATPPAHNAAVPIDSPSRHNSEKGHVHQLDPPLHEHFENLKGWFTGAYYSSEAGMTELGWTPNRVFESFPGCQHADHY